MTTNYCPVCHAGELKESYRAAPLDYSLKQTFAISVCSRCGYGRTGDLYVQPDVLYEGGCYDVNEKLWHKFLLPLYSLLEHGKLEYLGSGDISGKKLLEIGCGKGHFLEAARKKGFQVYGIEPSQRSFAFAAARLGGAVVSIGLEEIDTATEFPADYDYIVLWHVFEHLNDSSDVLSQLRGLLAANGRILIAIPNFASFQAHFGKAYWYHLDPPRHVHHFTPESMRMLALGQGLDIETMAFDSFYQNYLGELVTLTNKIFPGNNVVFNGLRLNRAYFDHFGIWAAWSMFTLALVLSLALALPLLLLTLINQVTGQSGTMVITMKLREGSSSR